ASGQSVLVFELSFNKPLFSRFNMSRRYSSRDKEKWVSDPSRPPKRSPIVLPETNYSRLIEEHRYTLIGRFTNPAMQNTRALRFLEISLKSGETKKVELEYEKLEKHCFSCLSLSHEAGNCPNKTASEDSPSPRLGITQLRTLDRIAESRKRSDNRKLSRFSPYDRNHGEPTNDSRRDHPRGQPQQRHDYYNWHDGRGDDMRGEHHSINSSSGERGGDRACLYYNEPLPPIRESSPVSLRSKTMRSANPTAKSYWRPVSEEGNGRQAHSESVVQLLNISQVNCSLQAKTGHCSQGGRTAYLSESADQPRNVSREVPLLHNGIANSDSGRLQDVNIQYLEDAPPYQTPPELLRASTSKAAAAGSAQEQSQIQTRKQAAREDSPIRTLSEDRAHVSLRLGPMPPLTGATSPEPTLSKAAGKRVTRAPPKSRVQGSPAKGVPVNKRKVTKAKSSPKRKLGNSRELIQSTQEQLEAALSDIIPNAGLIDSLQA
ncbi:hypothetical protein HID58_043608, partial [Brassica napus]